MQKISFGLTIGVIIGAIVFLTGACEASPIFNPDTGSYYEAIAGEYDWEEARDLAAGSTYLGIKGHLVTITSIEENNWIWTNLNEPFRYYIGASDREADGTWKWVTNEPWSFENWTAGEPNNGNGWYKEDALSFYCEGMWNDLPDTHSVNVGPQGPYPYILGYVVEYTTPEPATMVLFGLGGAGMAFLRRRKTFKGDVK